MGPKHIPSPVLKGTGALLLSVQTDYFRAGSVWEKIYGIWSCTRSSRILRWMVGMNQTEAGLALAKMGAAYQWKPLHPRSLNPNPVIPKDLTGNRPSRALARPVHPGRNAQAECPGSSLDRAPKALTGRDTGSNTPPTGFQPTEYAHGLPPHPVSNVSGLVLA